MARASDSARSRKKREGQKAKVPADLLAAKNKFEKQKKQFNQISRRLVDKSYDEKILKQNRERVKKSRDKKKAMQKENVPPDNNNPMSNSVSTITSVASTQSTSPPSSVVTVPASSSLSVMVPAVSSTSVMVPASTSSSFMVPASTSSSVMVPASTSSSLMVPASTPSSVMVPASTSSSYMVPAGSSTSAMVLAGSSTSVMVPASSSSSVLRPARSTSEGAGDFVTPQTRHTMKVRLPFSTPSRSRQKDVGEKRRRETLRDKNSDIDELHSKVRILEVNNEKLEDENLGLVIENCELKKKVTALEDDKNEKFTWMKILWKNCTPDLKKELKVAMNASKEELPKGVMNGIRVQTGINFSNPLGASLPTRGSNDLKHKIEDFANKNSFEVPDKKMAKKNIRYMSHWKIVLHQQFLMENPEIECHYTTFCAHFPSHIIKPGLNSHGSCLCEDCENFSLKIEALKRYKLLERDNIEDIIKSNREGDTLPEEEFLKALENIKTGEKKDTVISYFVWKEDKVEVHSENSITVRKKMTRKNYQVTVSSLIDRIVETFVPLKQHLHRDRVIKTFIREIRIQANDDSSMVCLTVDWSENGSLIIPGEVQSAFFGRATYSIHSGYMYQKDNSHGFAMLSDQNNHKAEAIWAALTPKLESLVVQGVKKFYICSDSTGAQYRNCKNAFFIRHFAIKHSVTVTWIFTEKHHGKSPADGIGGNVKHQVEQLTAFSTEHNIRNALDVVTLLRSTDTSIKVSHFDSEEIERTLSLIPGELNSLRGATKYHEIFVNPTGKILVKELPTDAQYGTVNITVKKKRGVPRTGIEAPVARVDDQEDET